MADTQEQYKRQLGFYDPDERKSDRVSIIGLGGIGSFVAVGVGKLGVPNIVLVDDDSVELHNLPNQFYDVDQIGLSKTLATAENVESYSGNADADALFGRIGKDQPIMDEWGRPEGIVVSGVDSMLSRQDIWENGNLKYNPRVRCYIDARIAGQVIVIYCVNPNDLDDVKGYEKTLHSDGEAIAAPCTERGVIDVGLTVGAMVTNMVRQSLTGGEVNPVTALNMGVTLHGSGQWVL